MAAEEEVTYDGIPYPDLVFIDVRVEPAIVEHIERRAERKGSTEYCPTVDQAEEAVLDPYRQVGPGNAKSGESVKVVGLALSAPSRPGEVGRVLKVFVIPLEHPPQGRWMIVTAMEANRAERSRYRRQKAEED